MEELVIFLTTYGWQLALIALIGVVLLGVLKYANLFSKLTKEQRKLVYFAISAGFSIAAAGVYLAIVGSFTVDYFAAVATAIYALNQTMYAVYDTTPLHTLLSKVLDALASFASKPKTEPTDTDTDK